MDLSIIISISGKPGLYKVVGQSRNGLIAESLLDQKRLPVRSTDKVSALSDISIFTYEDDLPLGDVFVKMHKFYDGKNTPDQTGDDKWLAEQLREILPEYDEDRVYSSDLKKLFKWYNLLNEKELIDQDEPESDEKEDKVEADENSTAEDNPKPKKAKKTKKD